MIFSYFLFNIKINLQIPNHPLTFELSDPERLEGESLNKMKITKIQTGQTTQVILREDNSVEVLSYNDATHKFELDYSIPNGGIEEFEMQLFFKFK